MLQLSAPIWLFTATAMALPLLIHLWNLRKGKRLKIGSLSLITQSIKPTARQVRLTEWLLLLLRCMLILLLAILLSQPYWQNKPGDNSRKGWVLVPRESIDTVNPFFKQQIDALLQSGYQLHAFDVPFETVNTNTSSSVANPVSYWQRLAQLDNRLPAGFPVVIFSDGRMEHFTGIRPAVSLSLQWHVVPETGSYRHLVSATQRDKDSVTLKFFVTGAAKNIFTKQRIPVNTSSGEIHFLSTDSGRFVQWQQQNPVRIDTGTLRIAVYQKEKQQDARYLLAALEAIRPMLDRPLQVTVIKNILSVPKNQDWVFWLSDEPCKIVQPGTTYFLYAGGEAINITSALFTNSNTSAPSLLAVYKRLQPGNNDAIVWKDGFGEPILTKNNNGVYHLYTHFDPSWSNLVWHAAFPELIFSLLQPGQFHAGIDRRQVDTAQLAFESPVNTSKPVSMAGRTDLSAICWWLLLLCLAIERWVSLRFKTNARAA